MNKLPFVWELNNKGITSHAIGTHHFIPNAMDYAADAAKYLQEKTYLLTETPENEPCPTEIVARASALTLAASLDQLTEQEQTECARILNTPLTDLRKTTLLDFNGALYAQSGYQELQPLEGILSAIAKLLNIENRGLETFQEQLEVVEKMAKNYTPFLRSIIEDERKQPGCIKSYAKKDIDSFINSNGDFAKPVNPDIFKARNHIMIERSMPYLSRPSAIAVGAMHFLEEPSLISLYQEKGIKVKRVQ